jgi:hypothetical protein
LKGSTGDVPCVATIRRWPCEEKDFVILLMCFHHAVKEMRYVRGNGCRHTS